MTARTTPPVALPAAPSGAAAVFGERMPLAVRFAEMLADTGVTHGLIGPREVPTAVGAARAQLRGRRRRLPAGCRLVDVGSGPGCRGSPWPWCGRISTCTSSSRCCAGPTWLSGVVADLGLDNVTVHRGRAEELVGTRVGAVGDGPRGGPARQAGPLVRAAARPRRHAGRDEGPVRARPSSRRTGARWSGSAWCPPRSREHGGEVLDEPVLTVDLRFEPTKGKGAKPPRSRLAARPKR